MPMPPYQVVCFSEELVDDKVVKKCPNEAIFKIAAVWSDGSTQELKTYFLACEDCVRKLYPVACEKRDRCRLTPGEILERPQIYEWSRGVRDQKLTHRPDLEKQDHEPQKN